MRESRWKNQLRSWREKADLTVRKAADGFGVSEYVYMKWECGESEPPATAFLRIPEVFGITEKERDQKTLVAVEEK